ncbi:MAG: hypothetical protein IJS17_03690 [Clostridia bacterium]|nr:hypothetical protein [Clostridia bacterium]
MEKPRGKALAATIVCVVFSLLSVSAYLLILIGLHRRFRFFEIVSGGRMFFYSLMVLLPLLVGVLVMLLYRHIGKKTKAALFALFATSVVLSLVFVIAFSIMPPCASVTTDTSDYLVFDESCPASSVSYNGLFPTRIPAEAENVMYIYRYYNYPDLCYDIVAQWRLPRAEYEAEKQRLFSLFPNKEVETIGSYSVVFISDEKKSTLDQIAFAFDDDAFTMRYIVSYIENVDINSLSPFYESYPW